MAPGGRRVEAPFLRQYVLDMPRYPRHAPQVPVWVQWAVFLVLAGITWPIPLEGAGAVGSIVIALGIPTFVRLWWRAKTPEEIADQAFLDEAKPLRTAAKDGSLRKRFPEPVLIALERLAGVRAAAMAKIAAEHPVNAAIEAEAIETRMRIAMRAALKTYRRNDQGRRDWLALCENREVLESLVRVIEEQEMLMAQPSSQLVERLAALRELNEPTPEVRLENQQG